MGGVPKTGEGAISAIREAGLRVPKDISVLGFDDILSAATHHPPLTTVHQPLRSMGQAVATTLLSLIRDDIPHPRPEAITVYPKLVIRESTSHLGHHADVSASAVETSAIEGNQLEALGR